MQNLLLVDDDPDLLRLLSIRLKASGYRASTADSGEQGGEDGDFPGHAVINRRAAAPFRRTPVLPASAPRPSPFSTPT